MRRALAWIAATAFAAGPVRTALCELSLAERIDAAVSAGQWSDVRRLVRGRIAEAEKAGERLAVARARHVAAVAEDQLGDPERALELLERAAADYAAAGAGAEDRAACADEAGRIAHSMGRFPLAEARLREAVQLRMDAGLTNAAAASRVHLAEALLKRGKTAEAGQEWARALADAGGDPAVRCLALRGLGVHAHTMGAWEEAVRLFGLARADADALGDDAPSVRASLDGQAGQVLLRMGRMAEAVVRLKAAEAWFSANAPGSAEHLAALNNLAAAQIEAGRLEAARDCLAGILTSNGAAGVPGEAPQSVALWLNLGVAEHRMHRLEDAGHSLMRAADRARRFLPEIHPLRSQIHLARAALARDTGRPDDAAHDAREASRLAIAWLRQVAGEEGEDRLLEFRRTLDPVSPVVAFAGRDAGAIAAAVLESQGAVLDLILARRRREAGAPATELPSILTDPPSVEGVTAAVPESTVLIHYVRWRDCGEGGVWNDAGRYGALILRRGLAAEWIDLGPAAAVDSRIFRIVIASQDAAAVGAESAGRASLAFQLEHLHRMIWEPLRDRIGDAERILIRPDGMLHFVPWAVLRERNGKESAWFCERYPLLEVIALPREGPRVQRRDPPVWRVLAVRGAPAAGVRDRLASAGGILPEPLVVTLGAMPPLSGVDREVEAIRQALPAAGMLDLPPAVEKAFGSGRPADVIHFAGHGFALEQPGPSGVPLMMAGLVMEDCADGLRARLNGRPAPADGDGILFASDAAALTFPSAPFVVLSGCQTGLGHWHPGDHLTGLRRAFLVAGASAVASTLWGISDAGAPEIVRVLYAGLARGEPPALALWNAQRDWLASPEARSLPESQRIALAGAWIVESSGWLPAEGILPRISGGAGTER